VTAAQPARVLVFDDERSIRKMIDDTRSADAIPRRRR